MPINQEQIIGLLLPYVSIRRVTLESSGAQLIESNPHIDSPREIVTPSTPNSLRVKLDLYLKDTVDDDEVSTWFDQQDFSKYLNLKIFQSTDPRITAVLSLGREMISLIDPDASVQDDDVKMMILKDTLKTDTVAEALDILYDNTEARALSVKRDMMGSDSKLSQHGAVVNNDGDKVFEINYSTSFQIKEEDPEHIAYFAMTTLDIDSLAKDFGLDYESQNLYNMNGKLASEVVIDDFSIKSVAKVYYTQTIRYGKAQYIELEGK